MKFIKIPCCASAEIRSLFFEVQEQYKVDPATGSLQSKHEIYLTFT